MNSAVFKSSIFLEMIGVGSDFCDLVAVWNAAVCDAIMPGYEQGVMIGVEGHGVAAIGKGERRFVPTGQAEGAKIFKVSGTDHVGGERRKRLGLGFARRGRARLKSDGKRGWLSQCAGQQSRQKRQKCDPMRFWSHKALPVLMTNARWSISL